MAKTNRKAKRLIEEAIPHVGNDVVIIAPGVNGHGYVATTLPTKTAANLSDMIVMTEQALKKMRRWRSQRMREEARDVQAESD
jgi:hypothetical protein